VKWAQNQSLGEKWAATSNRLRSTGLEHETTSKITETNKVRHENL